MVGKDLQVRQMVSDKASFEAYHDEIFAVLSMLTVGFGGTGLGGPEQNCGRFSRHKIARRL